MDSVKNSLSGKNRKIGIVPAGKFTDKLLNKTALRINEFFLCETEILPVTDPPLFSFDKNRNQYNGAMILKSYEEKHYDSFEKIIVILDVDIFIPIFTHVFGEARVGGKVALLSTFRLKKPSGFQGFPKETLYDRTIKVALHETAHLFNLTHCKDKMCLMHFSGDIEEIDKVPFNFCRFCTQLVKDNIFK